MKPEDINSLEKNLVNSFRLAKSDIIHMQDNMLKLSEKQKEMLKNVKESQKREALLEAKIAELKTIIKRLHAKSMELEVKTDTLGKKTLVVKKVNKKSAKKAKVSAKKVRKAPKTRTIVKKVTVYRTKAKRKHFVASKNGKKYHEEDSLMAKKIKPKDRIVFKSKIAAENAGYMASKVKMKA